MRLPVVRGGGKGIERGDMPGEERYERVGGGINKSPLNWRRRHQGGGVGETKSTVGGRAPGKGGATVRLLATRGEDGVKPPDAGSDPKEEKALSVQKCEVRGEG